MSRKAIETNISFDDTTNHYYVCFDCGKDTEGKRVMKYKTFAKASGAHKALREFIAKRSRGWRSSL